MKGKGESVVIGASSFRNVAGYIVRESTGDGGFIADGVEGIGLRSKVLGEFFLFFFRFSKMSSSPE